VLEWSPKAGGWFHSFVGWPEEVAGVGQKWKLRTWLHSGKRVGGEFAWYCALLAGSGGENKESVSASQSVVTRVKHDGTVN